MPAFLRATHNKASYNSNETLKSNVAEAINVAELAKEKTDMAADQVVNIVGHLKRNQILG